METKTDIRKKVFRLRKEAPKEQILRNSHEICRRVISLAEFDRARWIYLYIDCRNEVMTGEILREALARGKQVAAPRVEGKEMIFFRIDGEEDLEPGYFGIREPKQGLSAADGSNGLMIMPGVAFDRSRGRVGYGGGFYDRYLAAHPDLFTAAVAFEFQLFDQVPREETDILPRCLITEKQIYR